MCQMTWVRLQHCGFAAVNGGASAKMQVRGRSRRFAASVGYAPAPLRPSPKASSTHRTTQTLATIRTVALSMPPLIRGSTYATGPVDGKTHAKS